MTDSYRKHSLVSSVIRTSNYFDNRNSLVTLQSGTPFMVTTGKDTNLDGNNNDRANGNKNVDLGLFRVTEGEKFREGFERRIIPLRSSPRGRWLAG